MIKDMMEMREHYEKIIAELKRKQSQCLFLLTYTFLIMCVLASIICFGYESHADTFEMVGGGATYHLLGANSAAAQQFDNKWSNDGRLIGTPLIGARVIREDGMEYASSTVFAGHNSVGAPITGYTYSYGGIFGNWYSGIILGIYMQDAAPFLDRGVNVWGLYLGNRMMLMPIGGLEVDYKIPLDKNVYIKLDNIVSPAMINNLVSFGWNI